MANREIAPLDPGGLDGIFRPRSVALIGATARPGSIGREILNNLVQGDFNGPVFPVNPRVQVVRSLKCFASVLDIPDPVDLAVVVVPRDEVLAVAEACGRKGVKGLVVITAGFKEVGGEGIRREEKLEEILERYRMRMIGPNCMGVLNTEEDVRLNASFARTAALPGRVAMITQSGALGEVILEHARGLNLGFSMFASIGNKTNIASSELMEYLDRDQRTEILLLYLESFGRPARFTPIARRITRHKPVLAVKSGRTVPGARAAVSHTGALAGSDVATDALFEQCGVLRVESVSQMFDLALALACQPAPKGPRVAIVTNAGGPGILATDAAISEGLTVADLSPQTVSHLRERLPSEASVGNPVDLLASADPDRYQAALSVVLSDPGVDAALVIFVPPVMIDAPAVARVVTAASAACPEKPLLGCFMGQVRSFPELEREYGRRVPFYPYPEEACRCLAEMARYTRLRARPEGTRLEARVDPARGADLVRRVVTEGRRSLSLSESLALVEAYGVPVAPWIRGTEGEILEGADALGFPLVLKGDVPSEIHKSGRGLIAPGLPTRGALVAALRRMAGVVGGICPAPGPRGSGIPRFVLQRMLPPTREVLIGVVQDPVFGPLIGFGLGGIFAEVLKDVVFRIHPMTDLDAEEMLDGLRGSELLRGARGEPPVDRAALIGILGSISRLVEDFPQIRELDLNPIFAAPVGAATVAVDARVVLGEAG